MLDLWRPPKGAGDPIGCLATTYTFAPELFDEHCLARFLDIESDPDREDLAFILERESRLGSVYAGVLVDHTSAGVTHSLRWDALPVRIPGAKQHAKVSLLVWTWHIRIIVASANLTHWGYRINHEVAAALELTPNGVNNQALEDAVAFLRSLFLFVLGASRGLAEVSRGEAFLDRVITLARDWKPTRNKSRIRQHLAFTLPALGDRPPRSSLDEAFRSCRRRGGSPCAVRVASPFFDGNDAAGRITAILSKSMARGRRRKLRFALPAIVNDEPTPVLRLAAPKALVRTPARYQGDVTIEVLPEVDGEGNPRPWHAKMLALEGETYSALMIGSSNFTVGGMGVGSRTNAEANILTIVEVVQYGREKGQIEAIWPAMYVVADPETAEWLGARPENEEEEQDKVPWLPAGFLSATYRGGDAREIVLRFDLAHLPEEWQIYACGQDQQELLSSDEWRLKGSRDNVELAWKPVQPPEKLRIRWDTNEALLPLNVEDLRKLPPPAQLEHMSADDLLGILAASDPSAAFRAWARRNQSSSELFGEEMDSATPVDLDPLHRYDLHTTFLHRIRRRARVMAQMRAYLERPVFGPQALEWRLRGLIGIEALADRLIREFAQAESAVDEALLNLADFLIVLKEVNYQSDNGSMEEREFEQIFRPFLRELAERMECEVRLDRAQPPGDVTEFWKRVVDQCRK